MCLAPGLVGLQIRYYLMYSLQLDNSNVRTEFCIDLLTVVYCRTQYALCHISLPGHSLHAYLLTYSIQQSPS